MEFIKEYGASDSEDDKPTSEQYKASVNVPQSDGTEKPQGERHDVVDDMPEIVDDDLTDEEIQHLCREMGIMISDGTEQAQGVSDSEENKPVTHTQVKRPVAIVRKTSLCPHHLNRMALKSLKVKGMTL